MKVLFSNPPWWEGEDTMETPEGPRRCHLAGVRAGSRWPHVNPVGSGPDNYVPGDYTTYPFFMGYAATYLARETGVETRVRDSIAIRESYETYLRHIQEEQYDYIFMESASPSWEHDGILLYTIQKLSPRAKIVLTGPIVMGAENLMREYPVHACIKGEYEKGAVKVLNGAEGLIEHDLLSIAEMNASPYPYFDDLMATKYFDGEPHGQSMPQLQVWSSRGCPFKCIFCVWPAVMTGNDPDGTASRTVRQYSADYMEGFLTEMIGRYDYKCVYFDDDTFNLGNKHVERMCEVMRRIGLPWSAMCRADTSRMDSWEMMKDAGCFGVKLGFESGNQWVVDNIVNKHLDLDYAREAVHEIKRVGMSLHGTFTVGLPGETKEQMADTQRFADSLPLDSFQMSGTAEIEGTPLSNLEADGHLDTYAGARKDGDYTSAADGAKKWRELATELRGD